MTDREPTGGRCVVTVQCVACGAEREVAENEISASDYPCCNFCGSPMIAKEARSWTARPKEE